MDDAQGAQRLDPLQFTPVKAAHTLVAFEHDFHFLAALCRVTVHQHPQVLHGRSHARIVHVDKMRPGFGHALGCPQNIAGVTVAVQAQQLQFCRHLLFHQGQGLVAQVQPLLLHLWRYLLLRHQLVARQLAKGVQVQCRPDSKCVSFADQMHACHQAANPHQHLGVVQLGRTPAAPRADAEPEMAVHTVMHHADFMQAHAV